MRRLMIIGVLVAPIMGGQIAYAKSIPGVSTVASEGAMGCPQFLVLYAKYPVPVKALYLAWAQGFMTSMNLVRLNILHKPAVNLESSAFPVSAQWAYLINYCQQDHSARFIDAVITLMGAVQQEK